MNEQLSEILHWIDDSLWSYIALPGIVILGLYLSFKSNFVQIRKFPHIVQTFLSFFKVKTEKGDLKVHPLKAFFASIGGCIGIGNVVAICTAIQIGGPGALFWIWMTAIAGSILKYSEVFLGVSHRVPNENGGFDGGPMYFLKKIFKNGWVPKIAALLLCLYGIEIYQFGIVADTLQKNFEVDKIYIVLGLLVLVFGASLGGVRLVGQICSFLVPFFIICYLLMGGYVLFANIDKIPEVINLIVSSAFTGHAALGAFTGSSMLLAISQGLRRGCYSGDVGIGYASIIHSESHEVVPERQASLAIFDIFVDTFMVCTTSVLIILMTDLWKEPIDASLLIQTGLSMHFPYMEYFMPLFLFLLGYTTVIAYFCAGAKCAKYINKKYGPMLYYVAAGSMLTCFSFVDTAHALSVMSITGGCLLCINLYGIYALSEEISFNMAPEDNLLTPILEEEA